MSSEDANKINDIYGFEVNETDEKGQLHVHKLSEYAENVILIVNVASKCGLANQTYSDLTLLSKEHKEKGLKILLFPCQQFNHQEFDNRDETRAFVQKYSKDFLLMDEVKVNGDDAHPLYKYLVQKLTGTLTNSVKWNFTYFLIDRNGKPVRRYSPVERLPVDNPTLLECLK